MIGFAALQLQRAVPNFNWGPTFAPIPANALLVRDLAQTWFLSGLAGIADDTAACAVALKELLAAQGIDRFDCFGASSGGFASLLYGALMGADEVHAFSPVTYLPSRSWAEMILTARAENWVMLRKQLRIRLDSTLNRTYYDLRPFLQTDNGRTQYHIYYGEGHAKDSRHAEYLAGQPRVTLHPSPVSVHDVARQVQAAGDLDRVLAESYERLIAAPVQP